MSQIEKIAKREAVQAALNSLKSITDEILDTAVTIQQIAAPTFAEEDRAIFIQSQFKAVGLKKVVRDDMNNVYGQIPAASEKPNSPVVISAHLDTVFPKETDLSISKIGSIIYGPGLGDNSIGLAALIHLASELLDHRLQLYNDVWFVANVCEEGLGDLRGMRAVVDRFGEGARYIVVEGGLYGQISHQAIGVKRFRIDVRTAGGHSWGDFGQPSAIHELANLITAITHIQVPTKPKSTFNIGVINGGTSINTIAQSAFLQLDLRSEGEEELDKLVMEVDSLVSDMQDNYDQNGHVQVSMSLIGMRPPGSIPRQTNLVTLAEEALTFVGCQNITYIAGSTDANIPLSYGYQAVCIGLTESGNAHRLDEFIDTRNLKNGLWQLSLVVLAAAGLK